MRRISHVELAVCQRSALRWVQSKVGTSAGHPVFGYRQALINSIYRLHKRNSQAEATAYLEGALTRFQDQLRVDEIWDQFEAYLQWVHESGLIVADVRVVLDAPFGQRLHMGGILSRLDVTPNGYRGILFLETRPSWREELRFPLIQAAVAQTFSREVARVEVGIQDVDGSGLEVDRYSATDISGAQDEFRRIEAGVVAAAHSLPGGLAWLDRTR